MSSSKWLTVTGTLSNPGGATGLILEDGSSLLNSTANVPGTVKKLITGSTNLAADTYHQVSVPLTSSSNPTSGLFLGSYLFDFLEPTSAWNPLGSPTNTPLNVDQGYLIYYPNSSVTYSFAGQLRAGAVSPALSFTDAAHGFNLVPNPYPSAIDWNLAGTKTSLVDGFWIWNPAYSNYGAYGAAVGTGTSGTSKDIAVGQAFFVRATASSASLTLTDAARLHSQQAFLKKSQNVVNQLHLTVNGNNSMDEVVVAFDDRWSNEKDEADVDKMYGSDQAPQLSCVSADSGKLSIDALPLNGGDRIVPLSFSLNAAADVTFTASGMETFYGSIPVYLEDQLLNQVIDLRTNPVYTFSHTPGADETRFRLLFMGLTGTTELPGSLPGKVFLNNGQLYLDVPAMDQSEAVIGIYDALGRQFFSRKMRLNGMTVLTAPSTAGVYMIRAISGSKVFTGKVVVD